MSRLRVSQPQLELLRAVADGRAMRTHPMGSLPVVETAEKRYRWDVYNALVKKGLIETPPHTWSVNWQPVKLHITILGERILAKGES